MVLSKARSACERKFFWNAKGERGKAGKEKVAKNAQVKITERWTKEVVSLFHYWREAVTPKIKLSEIWEAKVWEESKGEV